MSSLYSKGKIDLGSSYKSLPREPLVHYATANPEKTPLHLIAYTSTGELLEKRDDKRIMQELMKNEEKDKQGRLKFKQRKTTIINREAGGIPVH